MIVDFAQIQVATARLGQIAFSRGDGADPTETLLLWRRTEGIEDGAVEQAAAESADDTISEIEAAIEEGGSFSTEQLREYLRREYETAWLVGWIARARRDAQAERERQAADAAKVKQATGG